MNQFFVVMHSQESDAVGLELEELRREQAGYEQQIQAVDEATKAIQEQIDSMACTVSQNKVLYLLFALTRLFPHIQQKVIRGVSLFCPILIKYYELFVGSCA